MADFLRCEPRVFDGDSAKRSLCQRVLVALNEFGATHSISAVPASNVYSPISNRDVTEQTVHDYLADQFMIRRDEIQSILLWHGLHVARADGIYVWPVISVRPSLQISDFSSGTPRQLRDNSDCEVTYTRVSLGSPLLVLGASNDFSKRTGTPYGSYSFGCMFLMTEALNALTMNRWALCQGMQFVVRQGYKLSEGPDLMIKHYPGPRSWGRFLECHYLLKTVFQANADFYHFAANLPDERFVEWCQEDLATQIEYHEIAGHHLDDLRYRLGGRWPESQLRLAEARALLAEIRYSRIPLSGVVSATKRWENYVGIAEENEGRLVFSSLASVGLFGDAFAANGLEEIARSSQTFTDDRLRSAAGKVLDGPTLALGTLPTWDSAWT